MKYKKIWIHTECGGEMDMKNHLCLKCKKRWKISEFLLDPYGLRQIRVPIPGTEKPERKTTGYAKWADRIPAVAIVAGRLPNWSRWLRIVSFLGTILVLSGLVYLIWQAIVN